MSIEARRRGYELHGPPDFDAEVLAALRRLHRESHVTARPVTARVERLVDAPLRRHLFPSLLVETWRRRHKFRLVDALYVGLSQRLEVVIVTTDSGVAVAFPSAELALKTT